MFKAIAVDLDGTLLHNDRTISAYTKDVLARAVNAGTEFIICTGRMYDSLKTILPQLPFCHYAITCMGAEVYDTRTNERVISHPMEQAYAETLVAYAQETHTHIQLYSHNILYTNSLDKYSDRYFIETTSQARGIDGDVMTFAKTNEFSKMILIDEEDRIPEHRERVQALLGGKLNICASCTRYVECSSLTATKDGTLNDLMASLGIARNELIVFGDSGNDVSMLANTGFSCAVANGWESAKKVSNLIVESNENDGVARTVARLILKERP